jgi:hypothetical protein
MSDSRTWADRVMSPAAELAELSRLRNGGVLTEQEYEIQKAQVLGS